MPLKIITDVRADNGNEFLCLTCIHSETRSGTCSEMDVVCTTFGAGIQHVPFRVTRCSEFRRREIRPPEMQYARLKKEAWIIVTSHEGRGVTLIPAADAESRGEL